MISTFYAEDRRLDKHALDTLVAQAQNGSREAFSKVYALTYSNIYYYIYKILKNKSDSEDELQNAYLIAYENIESLSCPAAFYKWLKSIAHSCCVDRMKRGREIAMGDMTDTFGISRMKNFRTRRYIESYESYDDGIQVADGDEATIGRKSRSSTYDTAFDKSLDYDMSEHLDERHDIVWAFGRLPKKMKSVVLLKYLDGLQTDEVASILGIKEGTVKSRLSYAREQFARDYEGRKV